MSFSKRIFLGFFLLLALVAYALLTTVFDELKPGFSRATEETLVDTANLLAEIIAVDMVEADSSTDGLAIAVQRYAERRLDARIYDYRKTEPGLRIYVTDRTGRVLFDSTGHDTGADYSRWNDVYLTLRGEYGARATRMDPDDEYSTVYYVAAPIMRDGEIVGVVSVGKASRALLPYLQASETKIRFAAIFLFAGGTALAALFAAWLTISIRKLTAYADAVSRGESATLPTLRERELATLAQAMGRMRDELEGKEYVEETVHALTHELKSPLAAIRGAAELLRENPASEDRERFLGNIERETGRLERITERMLQLASLERRDQLAESQPVDLVVVIEQAVTSRQLAFQRRRVETHLQLPERLVVTGDAFLLEQAVGNLLDNAIEFSPTESMLRVSLEATSSHANLAIHDAGPGLPPYAESRVFERFYSLPRPDGGAKGTGLGLSFVREVMRLHEGQVSVRNAGDHGVLAILSLPLAKLT